MNPAAELQELIEQAREHLQYMREFGIAYVGEAPLTALPIPLVTVPTVTTSAPPTAAKAPIVPTPVVAALAVPPGAVAPQNEGSAEAPAPREERQKTPTPPAAAPPAPIVVAPPVEETPKLSPPRSSAPPVAPSIPRPTTVSTPISTMAKAKTASLFDEPASLDADTAPADPTPHPGETLADIRAEMGDCKRCKLWTTRTKLVFGEGSATAEIMFVGEAPGADEDATGRPFIGRAGQLLTKMIEAIGLKREDVYIANVIKSRPPGNRNPEADEVKACSPFLIRQIASIKPRLIVTLGNPATQALLETKVGITKLRGEFQDYPRLPSVKVIPTFHPAYLLRSPDKKREAWEDLKKVRAFLRGE